MRPYNCIIVEDEPLAVEILQDYIRETPSLLLKAICPDAISALPVLQREQIDLIFLDLHLPRLKGLDFLRTLKHPPQVIVTTAYHQYALESYEYNVIDYLLKPIEFSRFLAAVNKLGQPDLPDDKTGETASPSSRVSSPERPFLFCTVQKKRVRVYVDEVLYIESQKEYSRLVTVSRTILTKLPAEQIEPFLASGQWLRVHRSFIAATSHIDAYSATELEIAGISIPIGRSYKELVQSTLDKLSH